MVFQPKPLNVNSPHNPSQAFYQNMFLPKQNIFIWCKNGLDFNLRQSQINLTIHLDSLIRDNTGSNLAAIWRSSDCILNSI